MKILVLGHDGMLGSDVMKTYSGSDVHGLSIGDVDIVNHDALKKKAGEISPDIIINCAAYTDVDGCETNRDTAFSVNGTGVKNIALICKDDGIKLVHISTDYVFDGNKDTPYSEDDKTNPVSVYGESKLQGETYLKEILDDYLIIRTQWLFGKNGKNFVTTMLKLAETKNAFEVVGDQHGSPTYTRDLAEMIKVIVDKNLSGTYHVSNSGFTSWYEFAKKIFELSKKRIEVKRVSSKEFPRPAKRPAYSVFDLSKLYLDTHKKIPYWADALKRYFDEVNLI